MLRTIILTIILVSYFSFGCSEENNDTLVQTSGSLETPDWSDFTHAKGTDPQYDIVFNQNEVLRFDIVITPDDWQTMVDDMTANYGAFGSNGGSIGGPPPGGNMTLESSDNPVFVPCSFNFNNIEWYKVGIRFKGNSSLRDSWQRGIYKIPFKLDFDEFEDEYEAINNQRFYGFKQLSLSNGFNDPSLIREKMATDIFREAGIKAARTSFCRIYLDYGEGPVYFGVYTIVEVIDDTMLDSQFGSDDGNCYKPEGIGASFAQNTFNEAYFENKTNDGDWSDVYALYNIVNSSTRQTDPAAWRQELESVFDVDYYLKYLAVNTTIQNWDTYGNMTHNYYLYNDPSTSKLTWIPWDNNEAFQQGKMGGALSLSFDEVNSGWPLIRYIIDDENYETKYKSYLNEFISNVYTTANINSKFETAHQLISNYVAGSESESRGYTFLNSSVEFFSSLNELNNHTSERINAVNSYLNQ
ncbi:MAG: CotH kinase family protein [Bacteroidetes bacterium]|nr:CotH kinase family protein [Bacteroidota bacterium]